MKKYLLALLLLTSVFAVAAETNSVQIATENDYNIYYKANGSNQFWLASKMISLKVNGGSSVYVLNYTSNFDDIYNLDDDTYSVYNPATGKNEKPGFDMSVGKFGYLTAATDENGNVIVDENGKIAVSDFQAGKGDVEYFSFTGSDGRTVTTKGWLLNTFDNDTEIFFAMTPISNGDPQELVNSYDPVGGYLTSRLNRTEDQNGALRINFGTSDDVGHEFVVGYVANESSPSGQPLPGVLTSCLVGLAATSIAARRRKQSRK